MIKKIIKAFYPEVCPNCNAVVREVGLCKDCKDAFRLIEEPFCAVCGRPVGSESIYMCDDCKTTKHYFKRNVSTFEYRGSIKECIYRFKYANMRCYSEYFAKETIKRYGKLLKTWNIDAIVAVPMYAKKQRKRGYNQAEEFAKALAKVSGIKTCNKLLIRRKDTAPMKTLNKQQRYENLKKAFYVNKNKEIPKRVLIVDDIFTTGSTLDACARVLLKAGVEKVYGLCITTGA